MAFLAFLAAAAAPDRGLLVQFVRLQDAAFAAQSAAACQPNGDEAEKALHDRYDRRLIEIVRWLQERFSDKDLGAAQRLVHGPDFSRTAPPCPADEAVAKAAEAADAAYAIALETFEGRIRLTLGDK
jgi:hypothetical protein